MWFMLTHMNAFQNGSDSILCPPCGHPQPVSGWHCPHTGRTPCQRLPLPSLQERPVPYRLQAKERSVHRYKMKLKVVMLLLVLHQLYIYLSISGLCFAIYNLQNLFIVCLRHCLFVCLFYFIVCLFSWAHQVWTVFKDGDHEVYHCKYLTKDFQVYM